VQWERGRVSLLFPFFQWLKRGSAGASLILKTHFHAILEMSPGFMLSGDDFLSFDFGQMAFGVENSERLKKYREYLYHAGAIGKRGF
jgi:hypothetical protein